MTAAFGELIGPTVRGRAGRVACVLAFALPVPLCAALGLSLPLPTSVERLAAKLVPFATSPDTRAGAARGSIALAADERPRAGVDAAATTAAVVPDARVRRGTRARGNRLIDLPSVTAAPLDSEAMEQTAATRPTADRTASPVASPEQPASNTPITSAPNTSTAAPPPAATGGGTESGGGGSETPTAPAPTPPSVVETATNTASGAVTTVTNTTQPVAETTKETVDSTVNTAQGVVGGLKPP
jgi:hypothetical protein